MAGELMLAQSRARGGRLLPIDSEHCALHQCLQGCGPEHVRRLVLTASGGPFRRRPRETFAHITLAEALRHPTWNMGRKITIDSATLMNKGLEVIEARWLFDLPPERIDVVIHPQSIVHSMVVCRDGSVLAQMGTPDMRVPIAYGLSFPERIESGAPRLDFHALAPLSFEPADERRFPSLALAWAALEGPAGSTTVLNAANEVAVEAFLDRRIGFDAIHRLNAAMLAQVQPEGAPESIDALLALDARTRAHAAAWVQANAR